MRPTFHHITSIAAQNTANDLFNTNDPRALHCYIERWKNNKERITVDHLLSVITTYMTLVDHTVRPDTTFGSLTLHYNVQRATWRGIDLNFTVTEFRVVKELVDQCGTFLTYRSIYDTMHYKGFVAGCGIDGYKTNVRSHIKRIRRKFERIDPEFTLIENYNNFGYRWAAQPTPQPPLQPAPKNFTALLPLLTAAPPPPQPFDTPDGPSPHLAPDIDI